MLQENLDRTGLKFQVAFPGPCVLPPSSVEERTWAFASMEASAVPRARSVRRAVALVRDELPADLALADFLRLTVAGCWVARGDSPRAEQDGSVAQQIAASDSRMAMAGGSAVLPVADDSVQMEGAVLDASQ